MKVAGRLLVTLLLPLLPFAGLGLRSRAAMRELAVWLITIVPFTSVWMLIILDNNHYARFQYVMVPISMMALGGLIGGWWHELKEAHPELTREWRLPAAATVVVLFGLAIFSNLHFDIHNPPFSNVGAQDLAARLKPYAPKDYAMVVTEAGDLPFYSDWRAVDALGLNDVYLAHHGGLMTQEYLERVHPEIIMYRVVARFGSVADFAAQMGGPKVKTTDRLTNNDMAMNQYAVSHGYILAAAWGPTYCDYLMYWVRPDFADSAAIVSDIRDHPYYSQVTGQLAYDFSKAPVPNIPCWVHI